MSERDKIEDAARRVLKYARSAHIYPASLPLRHAIEDLDAALSAHADAERGDEVARARAEWRDAWEDIRGVHGALIDAGSVRVPELRRGADHEPAVRALIAERDLWRNRYEESVRGTSADGVGRCGTCGHHGPGHGWVTSGNERTSHMIPCPACYDPVEEDTPAPEPEQPQPEKRAGDEVARAREAFNRAYGDLAYHTNTGTNGGITWDQFQDRRDELMAIANRSWHALKDAESARRDAENRPSGG